MWYIRIPGKTPTLNTLYRSHFHKSAKEKKEWGNIMHPYIYQAKLPKPFKTPVSIHVTQFSAKLRDADNCIVAIKVFCDVLKQMGYLEDDNPNYVPTVILSSKKCKTKKDEKMVFLIQSLKK